MFLLLFLSALWSILKLITSSLVLFDSRSVDTLPPTVSINGELRPPSPFMPDPFNRSRSILRGITMNWSIDQRPAITGGYKLIVLFRPIGFTYPNERFGAFNQIAAPRYAKIYSSFEKKNKWIGLWMKWARKESINLIGLIADHLPARHSETLAIQLRAERETC